MIEQSLTRTETDFYSHVQVRRILDGHMYQGPWEKELAPEEEAATSESGPATGTELHSTTTTLRECTEDMYEQISWSDVCLSRDTKEHRWKKGIYRS